MFIFCNVCLVLNYIGTVGSVPIRSYPSGCWEQRNHSNECEGSRGGTRNGHGLVAQVINEAKISLKVFIKTYRVRWVKSFCCRIQAHNDYLPVKKFQTKFDLREVYCKTLEYKTRGPCMLSMCFKPLFYSICEWYQLDTSEFIIHITRFITAMKINVLFFFVFFLYTYLGKDMLGPRIKSIARSMEGC